jgi:hypothetical protein
VNVNATVIVDALLFGAVSQFTGRKREEEEGR